MRSALYRAGFFDGLERGVLDPRLESREYVEGFGDGLLVWGQFISSTADHVGMTLREEVAPPMTVRLDENFKVLTECQRHFPHPRLGQLDGSERWENIHHLQ